MKTDVATAIEELKLQFEGAEFTVVEDGGGGAKVIFEPVVIGGRYDPSTTWMGFHITPQYPYADIYPIFIGGEVKRVDGKSFEPPVTNGHTFEGRSAVQVSRRNAAAGGGSQTAVAKAVKVLQFLENYQ